MIVGIILVIAFLSILILVHESGHFLAAKKFGVLVEEFGIGLPPRIWGKKIGETIYSVNWLPFGGFVKIFGENGEDEGKRGNGRNFSSLPAWKRAVILFAGVAMNFLLGWLAVSAVFLSGVPATVLVADVVSGSPAEAAGVVSGDILSDFSKVEDFQSFVAVNQGKEISFAVERGGEIVNLSLAPRIDVPNGEGPIGVSLIQGGFPKAGFWESVSGGLKFSVQALGEIFRFIFDLLKKIFVGQADFSQVAGPVGMVKITYQAGSMGVIYLLQLLALISLNLVVLNILPFPALDGGRLLFLLMEKIKGSPLPLKFERYANAAGMALLLILMIAITVKDINGFF